MNNKNSSKSLNAKTFDFNIILLCLCVTAVLFIIWTFTGQWPWKGPPYNSYILQVQSWLEGRLDLGQNYSHLELAIFDGKYFVSFPPFPSYVMLPFVLIGWDACDSMIAFAASLAGAVYAYKILRHFNIESNKSIFFTLFLTVGSNWLMTSQNAWVWFIAQNMAFTLSLMAIYYALKNKAGLSLSFWACAVGCRPMQILYIPVIIYILYKKHMTENPKDKLIDIVKKKYLCLIAPCIIALSYMILNYMRFGSITEFGHNYLPEFMRVEEGQFNICYIPKNLYSLIRLPGISNGKLNYPAGDGMCVFMISPILISYIIYLIRSVIKKDRYDNIYIIISSITVIEVLLITAHKTMGGAHFGNRYMNDILPVIFLGLASLLPQKSKLSVIHYPLFFMGFALNLIGCTNFFT